MLSLFQMFTSTSLVNTVTKHFLERTVTVRFVRFWPKEWAGRSHMRVEVYGCEGEQLRQTFFHSFRLNGQQTHSDLIINDPSA